MMMRMKEKEGVRTESDICRIENGYLLTYRVAPHPFGARFDNVQKGNEYYKTYTEATARLTEILLDALANELDE